MKNPKRLVLIVIVLLAAAFIGARVTAHKAASDYARTFKQALSMVGVAGFADTTKLREFLASPEMTANLKRIDALSFAGGGYRSKVDELQRGMIYFSEQMALPAAERFSSPPAFHFLALDSSDRSDSGVARAAKGFLASYESQL